MAVTKTSQGTVVDGITVGALFDDDFEGPALVLVRAVVPAAISVYS
jgi:hypothetical protein